MDSGINIKFEIEQLLEFGLTNSYIHKDDVCMVRNRLYDFLQVDDEITSFEPGDDLKAPEDIVNNILQYCYDVKLLADSTVAKRDNMAAKLMSFIVPNPSEVIRHFNNHYLRSPMEATDYLYTLYMDMEYVQRLRVRKRDKWEHEEDYGRIECFIAFTEMESPYPKESGLKTGPKCEYCPERVGFESYKRRLQGRNLRLIKQKLADEVWCMGYSPSAFYNEHCVVASESHKPHKITADTFKILVEFLDIYPHYFLGADADLPLVGITGHSRFQGGCKVFPVEQAETLLNYTNPEFETVSYKILKWPVSVIRLTSNEPEELVEAANHIYTVWKGYSDEKTGIVAFTKSEDKEISHNSITVAARMNKQGNYEMDIFLRNDYTAEENEGGIFGVPVNHKNIKTDSVRLMDVMGRMALSAELENELLHMISYLMSGKKYKTGDKKNLDKHQAWLEQLQDKYGVIENYNNAKDIIKYEVTQKFAEILKNSGVFKLTEEGLRSFEQFGEKAGLIEVPCLEDFGDVKGKETEDRENI